MSAHRHITADVTVSTFREEHKYLQITYDFHYNKL